MAESNLKLGKSWLHFFFAICFLSGALAWSVFCIPYLPTNDGPQHILSAYIENHYNDPGSIYPIFLERSPQFAYRGFALVMRPMEMLFGWQLGTQFAISIILLLNAWGFTALVLAFDSKRKWVACFGFPLAWSWSLYMGFFSFTVGTALGYWILAYVLAVKKWNWVRWVTLSAALCLQAMSHVFTAGLTGLVMVCLLVMKEPTWLDRAKRLLVVGLAGLPAATIALGTLVHRNDRVTQPVHPSWLSFDEFVSVVPHILIPGPSLYTLSFLSLIFFAVGITLWRLLKNTLSFEEKFFFGVGIGSLAVIILCPLHIEGWQFFTPRFSLLGLSSLLLLLPFEAVTGKSFIVSARLLVVAASLISINTYTHVNMGLASSCEDLIAAVSMSSVRRGISHFVPLSVSCGLVSPSSGRPIPFMNPELQAGALYAVATSSLPSTMFMNSLATSAFAARTGPSAPVRKSPYRVLGIPRLVGVDVLALTGMEAIVDEKSMVYRFAAPGMEEFYKSIFVTGATETNIDLLKGMGYVELWHHRTIWVGRFEPCTIVFKPNGNVPYRPKLTMGLYPFEVSIFVDSFATANSATYEYPHAPCGDAWVRMEPNLSGTYSIYDPKNRPYLTNRVFVSD
jgi:hypothetical protein